MPSACTIAGMDSCGGAGVIADIKTFTTLGVWGCAAVTAVTAQNCGSVEGVWMMGADAVRAQITSVCRERVPAVFKTGMLGNHHIVLAVAESLPRGAMLVVDPVMVSTSGVRLTDEKGIRELSESLVPLADIVTPNIPEAEILAGMECIRSSEDVIEAGNRILDLGPGAVLIKGGHAEDAPRDYLFNDDVIVCYEGIRRPYQIHGSGCCLSAAIAAYLARGEDIEGACRKSKEFVSCAIDNAVSSSIQGIRMINPAACLGSCCFPEIL